MKNVAISVASEVMPGPILDLMGVVEVLGDDTAYRWEDDSNIPQRSGVYIKM